MRPRAARNIQMSDILSFSMMTDHGYVAMSMYGDRFRMSWSGGTTLYAQMSYLEMTQLRDYLNKAIPTYTPKAISRYWEYPE